MDIDEFLDKETSKVEGKEQVTSKGGSGGKRDNENLLDQLETVKSQLKENKVDTALKEFDYLKSRYTDMTKKQLSENRYIFNELIRINQEIITKIDNQRGEFEKRKQMVRKLLNDAYVRFNNGELETAYKVYIEATEMLKNMPDLFSEEKNRLNYEVTAFSVQLFPKLQEQTDQDFEQKKSMILQEINQAYQYMQTNASQIPPQTYDNINSHFQQLPEGHIYEKAILYNDILKLFRSTSLSGEVNTLVQEMLKQQQGFANSVLGPQPQQSQTTQATTEQNMGNTPQENQTQKRRGLFSRASKKETAQTQATPQSTQENQPEQQQTEQTQMQEPPQAEQTKQEQPKQEQYQMQEPPQAEQTQNMQQPQHEQQQMTQQQMGEPPQAEQTKQEQPKQEQYQDIQQQTEQQMDTPPETNTQEQTTATETQTEEGKKSGLFSKLFKKKEAKNEADSNEEEQDSQPTKKGGEKDLSLE